MSNGGIELSATLLENGVSRTPCSIVPGAREVFGLSFVGLVGRNWSELGYRPETIAGRREANEATKVIRIRAEAKVSLSAFLAFRPGNGILTGWSSDLSSTSMEFRILKSLFNLNSPENGFGRRWFSMIS